MSTPNPLALNQRPTPKRPEPRHRLSLGVGSWKLGVDRIVVCLLAVTALSAGQARQTFVGTITDDMCAKYGHRQMRMGPTDADCTVACVMAHDAKYVLYDGKEIYILSDQQTPEKFAGTKVRVVGTLDAKTRTIKVESITAAE
jgi:hypothetical protein